MVTDAHSARKIRCLQLGHVSVGRQIELACEVCHAHRPDGAKWGLEAEVAPRCVEVDGGIALASIGGDRAMDESFDVVVEEKLLVGKGVELGQVGENGDEVSVDYKNARINSDKAKSGGVERESVTKFRCGSTKDVHGGDEAAHEDTEIDLAVHQVNT